MAEFTVLNWSRDWSKFDIEEELKRVDAGLSSVFTKETFAEYIRWLRVYRPELYLGYVMAELMGDDEES